MEFEKDEEINRIYFILPLPEEWIEFYQEYLKWAGLKNNKKARLILMKYFNLIFQDLIRDLLDRVKNVSSVKYRYFIERYNLQNIGEQFEFNFSPEVLQEYEEFYRLIKTEIIPKLKGEQK